MNEPKNSRRSARKNWKNPRSILMLSVAFIAIALSFQNFGRVQIVDQILNANPSLHTIVWTQPTIPDGTIPKMIDYQGNPKNPVYNSWQFWLDATLNPGYTLQEALGQPVPANNVGDFTTFYPQNPSASQMGNNAQYGSVAVQAEGGEVGVMLSPATFGCCDPNNSYPSANLSLIYGFSPLIAPWAMNDSAKVRFSGLLQVPKANLQGGAKVTAFMELWFNEQPELPANDSWCESNNTNGPCCIGPKGQCAGTQMVSEFFNLNQPQYNTYFGGDPRVGATDEIIQVRLNPNQPYMTQLTGSAAFSPNPFLSLPFSFEISAQQLVRARQDHAKNFGESISYIETSGSYYQISIAQLGMEIQWLAPNPFAWGSYTAKQLQLSYSNPQTINANGLSQVNISAEHSGSCIDLQNGSGTNGTAIQQWQCLGPQQTQSQVWNIVPMGDGSFEIVSANTGSCLDVTGASKLDGALIQEWQCTKAANQKWRIIPAGNTQYQIVSVNSGKCLDVVGVSPNDGTRLQQYDCLGVNQRNQIYGFFDP